VVEQAEPAAQLAPEGHVLCCTEVGEEVELLVDDRDPEIAGVTRALYLD
jgi:hypothetical protein